jgi:hypothetical protein
MEEQLTPEQSLSLISDVMMRTRENIRRHHFIFLLWGWLLVAASLGWFMLQTLTSFRLYFLPFPICVLIGLVVSFIYYRRLRNDGQLSYLEHFIRVVWTVLAAGFIAVVLVSLYQHIRPFSYTLIIAAIGTMITGRAMNFTPLIYGSIVFLLAAFICLVLPTEYKVLVHGAAILFGYVVPGYMLRNSKQASDDR